MAHGKMNGSRIGRKVQYHVTSIKSSKNWEIGKAHIKIIETTSAERELVPVDTSCNTIIKLDAQTQ